MGHEARDTALAAVDARMADLSGWTRAIWELAEPAWREYRSARLYVDLLRAEGFDVEVGTGGMPTAFRAQFGSGSPVVATYAEYDAVPGNSQAAVPHEAPREGTTRHAAGHTDPHSALGVGALGGALAAKAAMERHGLAGTLVVFGEPAEKVQGSKPVHAAKGYYDELDAAISFHPAYVQPLHEHHPAGDAVRRVRLVRLHLRAAISRSCGAHRGRARRSPRRTPPPARPARSTP